MIKTQFDNTNRIQIVLVRPIYPRNIGMCARAAANMGCNRLIVIDSKVSLSEHETKQGAAGAQDMLSGATQYASLKEMYLNEGDGLRIAFSGLAGRLRSVENFESLLSRWTDHFANVTAKVSTQYDALARKDQTSTGTDSRLPLVANPHLPIYLFFGTEDDGLSDFEMEMCHHICSLPTFGEFTSLNLSHAVLLASYMLSRFLTSSAVSVTTKPVATTTNITTTVSKVRNVQAKEVARPNQTAPLYFPDQSIDRWLEAMGFDLSSPKVNVAKTLKRVLISQQPSADDLRILDSVLQQTIRRLKK